LRYLFFVAYLPTLLLIILVFLIQVIGCNDPNGPCEIGTVRLEVLMGSLVPTVFLMVPKFKFFVLGILAPLALVYIHYQYELTSKRLRRAAITVGFLAAAPSVFRGSALIISAARDCIPLDRIDTTCEQSLSTLMPIFLPLLLALIAGPVISAAVLAVVLYAVVILVFKFLNKDNVQTCV